MLNNILNKGFYSVVITVGFIGSIVTAILIISNVYSASQPLSSFKEISGVVRETVYERPNYKEKTEAKIKFKIEGSNVEYFVFHDVEKLKGKIHKKDKVSVIYEKWTTHSNVVALVVNEKELVTYQSYKNSNYQSIGAAVPMLLICIGAIVWAFWRSRI